jgi:hypothetical protein
MMIDNPMFWEAFARTVYAGGCLAMLYYVMVVPALRKPPGVAGDLGRAVGVSAWPIMLIGGIGLALWRTYVQKA